MRPLAAKDPASGVPNAIRGMAIAASIPHVSDGIVGREFTHHRTHHVARKPPPEQEFRQPPLIAQFRQWCAPQAPSREF
jgi:hypothetical protein